MSIESQSTTTGTVAFHPAGKKITDRERNDAYINGILNGETTVRDASGEYLPAMGFWNGKEYARATQENTLAITKDSIKQVSIDMPPGPDGKVQTRYFRQIAATDGSDNNSGLNASAWEEIDKYNKPVFVDKNGKQVAQGQGKREIRFSTTGFLEPEDITALNTGVQGKLNPQTADMAAFTGKALKIADAQMGKGNYEAVFHSHSYGGIAATAARVVTELHGVPSPTRTIKFDGGPIGDAQMDLLKAAMHNPESDFYKAVQTTLGTAEVSAERMHAASENLNRNNLLLVPIGRGEDGRWHTSAIANAVPGEGWTTGLTTMAKDAMINKDRGIEGSNNPHGDVVFVKVQSPKGYKTTAEGGGVSSLHQEVPTLYSVTNPDNLVVAVHTPNGKPPVTFDSYMEEFAKFAAAASPVTAAIKKLGGDDKAFINSAVSGLKGSYLDNARQAGEAILSIFIQSAEAKGHAQPAESAPVQSTSVNPRQRR